MKVSKTMLEVSVITMCSLTARFNCSKVTIGVCQVHNWGNIRSLIKPHRKLHFISFCPNKRRVNHRTRVKEGEEMFCDTLQAPFMQKPLKNVPVYLFFSSKQIHSIPRLNIVKHQSSRVL